MAETEQTAMSEQEELELELQLLRSVAGVTSANAYPRQRVDPCLNSNFVKVVVERACLRVIATAWAGGRATGRGSEHGRPGHPSTQTRRPRAATALQCDLPARIG